MHTPCASDATCKTFNRATSQPGTTTTAPLCDACLDAARRDIGALLYDYVDLAQLQHPTLTQAPTGMPGARREPPMPLKGAPEALQAEIHHVTTTWAGETRAHLNLADPHRPAPVAWHTTLTRPAPTPTMRPGAEVQAAVTTLTTHLHTLARIPATAVHPTGCEDTPTDMHGWEAVHHLQHLHQRARGMLGRTHRTTHLPGTCPNCGADQLHRDEPRHPEDPCNVYCTQCGHQWPYDDYQQYVTNLVWPTRTGALA